MVVFGNILKSVTTNPEGCRVEDELQPEVLGNSKELMR